ncbi:MAG TPA: type II toxin-antitoxin system prevent-host-death family antitoxin [Dermatophilaceae bacterium]|nr:type II toxin-antitoxin system prevent-host-death family antitoxin [Dermatophilaceae bacterium]
MNSIGIRQLRQEASQHVAAAASGVTITVTDRGIPVAKLAPLSPLEHHLAQMVTRHDIRPPVLPRRRFAEDARLAASSLAADVLDARAEREAW